MYHPPTKRKQIIQRVIVYSLMSLSVVFLVVALVFIMLGYRFNRADGKIEQGGLVQFDTQPDGARVTIDDMQVGSNTPSKSTVTTGQHFITMTRSGYKTWQKSVDVAAGSVVWLSYARLIPNELKPVSVADFTSVSGAVASPDDRWMAIQQDPAAPNFQLIDLSREKIEPKILELPADSYTQATEPAAPQVFELTTWDPSSRYVLIKHMYDTDKFEWIVADTQQIGETKNITRLLSIDASKLVFDPENSRLIYARIGTDVRVIDVQAATMSRPLVSDAAEFALDDKSTLVYTTTLNPETGSRSVGYFTKGADKPRIVQSYKDDGSMPLHIATGTYFDEKHIAIAYGEHVTIKTGVMPRSDSTDKLSLRTVATMSIPSGSNYLSILNKGRFVVAQHGAAYTTYDLELHRMNTTILKGNGTLGRPLDWIDNYMIASDLGGVVRLYEFDGANQHDIMPVVSGMDTTLSPSGKYFYGIAENADGTFSLKRVQLILS